MYVLQDKPDVEVVIPGPPIPAHSPQRAGGKTPPDNSSVHTPLATLKDEYGGVSHIIEDDHCYVLVNGSKGGSFAKVDHWYPEAVDAMKTLPAPRAA